MSDSDTANAPKGFLAELRDAVTARAALLVVGVFVIELAFIVSYLGAFHSPTPHRIPVAVAAPAQVQGQVVSKLNALPGDPVRARPAADRAEARRQILRRTVDAAFVVNPRGTTDSLLVASAGGPSVAQTASQIAQEVEKANGRSVRVTDIRPPHKADGRGLSSFYLVIGLVIGGYVASSALAMSHGARPANVHRTTIRLGALALLSIASGLGGAIIVDPVFGALPGNFGALCGIGALTTFTAAAVGMALQVLFGQLGVGLALLIFVVLGNPSSGGVYPSSLLPPFWSAIGQALPSGAATTLVRNTVYFHGNGTSLAWWVLAAWAAGGLLVSYAASLRGRRAASAA
ncbi:ABC transporter permease [Streptomyces sp. NPDC020096]